MTAVPKIDRRKKLAKSTENVERLLDSLQYEASVSDLKNGGIVVSAPVQVIKNESVAKVEVPKKPVDTAADIAMQVEGQALVKAASAELGLKHLTKNIWLRGTERCAVRAVIKPRFLLLVNAAALKDVETLILVEKNTTGTTITEINAAKFRASSKLAIGVPGKSRGKDVYMIPMFKALELNKNLGPVMPVTPESEILLPDLSEDDYLDR